MLQAMTVFGLSVAYLGLLFAIAWVGDRYARAWSTSRLGPIVYGLSIAIYCTSWTFYGSVGRASTSGPDFILIYVGPVLVMVLGYPLLRKMVQVGKANGVTSIADFLAARYGKSRAVAVAATLIATLGVVPYIALQLQAVSASFRAIAGPTMSADGRDIIAENTSLIVTALMAVFTILFGVRSVQAGEQHRGMMLAIAFESVVKLLTFLAVGAFVIWGLFGGAGDLLARLDAAPSTTARLEGPGITPNWLVMTALAAAAFLCLPRQFHVAIVEHDHPGGLKTARWMFPLYLVLINLFVIPIAAGGLLLLGPSAHPDLFVLTLPLANGHFWLSVLVFIGGLSAATSMVIVACMALSAMIGNELVSPYLLRRRAASDENLGPLLINVRRLAVVVILLAAYAYYQVIAGYLPLVSIGLISFAAVANFAPGLILGLYWRRAHRFGVVAGLGCGFVVWAWTLLLPSVQQAREGTFVAPLARFMPEALGALDPVSQGFLVGLLLNTAVMVAVSLLVRASERDRRQADLFVLGVDETLTGPAPAAAPPRIEELRRLVAQFIGSERADEAFAGRALSLPEALALAERLLSGAVGAASARVIVASAGRRRLITPRAARAMLDEASEAIRHNYGILKNALDHVGLGFAAFDGDGRLEAWNERFPTLLTLEGRRVAIGAAIGALGAPALAELACRPGVAQVQEVRRSDGTVIELRLDPLPSGGFVVTCHDVTERVRTAEALRDSERRIRGYTDNVPALIAYIDRDQRYRFTNRPYQVAQNLSAPETEGRSIVEVIGLERYRRLLPHIEAVLRGEPQSFEIEFPTNDAKIEIAAGTYIPHRDEQGAVQGFFLLYQDITGARRTEDELRQAKEMLERRVAERTAELTRVVAELEQSRGEAEAANLGKTRFIAAASHDLLQPLHAARLFTAALAERQPQTQLVGKIDHALGAVEALLGTLLDISKLDAGAVLPDRRAVAVQSLFDSLATAFAPMAAASGAELEVVASSTMVATDAALLRRILQNFLSNALRYGGGTDRKPRVLLGCRRAGDAVRIEVWDNGPGIPPEQHGRVFDEFVRLAPAAGAREADRGLGLGLAIVQRIARTLDVPVSLRSEPGRGTMFAVTVPLADEATAPAAAPSLPVLSDGRDEGAVVLCIDDEAQVREAMSALLVVWGCSVVTAPGLEEAEHIIGERGLQPDLLLVDLHLGEGPDGLAVIERLRRRLGREVTAALVTADREPPLQLRARQARVELLHKPVKPAALRALVRSSSRRPLALTA
jgi:PAS domain S-box-containing protein